MIIPCILPGGGGGGNKSLSFAQIVHNCPKHDNSSEIIFKKNPNCLKERYAGDKIQIKNLIKEGIYSFSQVFEIPTHQITK